MKDRLDDEANYKDEYLFNYWVLENIYKLDLEICKSYIVDYKDGGIDCFVFNEDDKDLFLIQNKYYNKSSLTNEKVSDFITRPIALLQQNEYKRSEELQDIYNQYSGDSDFTIYFHLYCTSDKKSKDIEHIISNAKQQDFKFELFTLRDIAEKYYSMEGFERKKRFSYKIPRANKRHVFHVNNQEHDIKEVSDVMFVQTSITKVYELLKEAIKEEYPIFEKNIREYLGSNRKNSINSKILETLKSEEQRKNFVLYNNGVTIICDKVEDYAKTNGYTEVHNPQIVNGCQTVNTIKDFFDAYPDVFNELDEKGNTKSSVSIMLKIIALNNTETDFYTNIVRYTNSQNAVNEKLFSSATMPFEKIKENLKHRGILICIKQSDKYTYKKEFESKKAKDDLLIKANSSYGRNNWEIFKKFNDLNIDIERMLQILIAFYYKDQGSYYAYTKKSKLLDKTSKIYVEFSCKVNDLYTTQGICNLIGLYRHIETRRKENNKEKEKELVTFLSLGFIAYFISEYTEKCSFDYINEVEFSDLIKLFDNFIEKISIQYFDSFKKHNKFEYNNAIKKEIDKSLLDEKITTALDWQRENLEKLLKCNLS